MDTETSPLRAGLRLASQVCAAEVIVVRPGSRPVSLHCGGAPMVERGTGSPGVVRPVEGQMRGSLLGKRYTHPEDPALEVLVSAGGDGTLSDGGQDLVLKDAKPLPASD